MHPQSHPAHSIRNNQWQSQLVLSELLEEISRKKPEVFFLQIGACDGVLADPIRPFVLRPNWRGILVEPLPDLFEKLKANYAGKSGLYFENVAVTESEGIRPLIRVNPEALKNYPRWAAGCSTFVENSKNMAYCPDLYNHLVTEDVKTLPLTSLIKKYEPEYIDLLQIDTEGYDYKVLSQFDFTRFKPLVINMEYVHLTDEEKMATCALLNEQGYAFRTHQLDLLAAQKSFLDTLA